MGAFEDLEACVGFDWGDGNEGKTWERHRVSDTEAEAIFFNDPLIVRSDEAHSKRERRYHALGRTGAERHLFVAFAIRGHLIRVISARDMTGRERRAHTS